MKEFPGRPAHHVPAWVKPGNIFHIRLRCDPAQTPPLTDEPLAHLLLDAFVHYHHSGRWFCRLAMIMPDHVHALLAFDREAEMSSVIGKWKIYAVRKLGVCWQSNYFDHRIRSPKELDAKEGYIRCNPVAKGLCIKPEDWAWVITPQPEDYASRHKGE
jgi:putative transposase